MRHTLRLTTCLLVAFGLLSFAPGCQTPTLQIDEPGDVSRYRTWDFVRPVRGLIHAPLLEADALEPVVARQVETSLFDRGFRRTRTNPDVLLYFRLSVRGQLVKRNVTGAIHHLASLHSSASYDVQATHTELTRYDIAELLVLMIDPREHHLVWRGRLNRRYRDEVTPYLGELVSQLLAHLPPPRHGAQRRTVIVKEEAPPRAHTTSPSKAVVEALIELGS